MCTMTLPDCDNHTLIYVQPKHFWGSVYNYTVCLLWREVGGERGLRAAQLHSGKFMLQWRRGQDVLIFAYMLTLEQYLHIARTANSIRQLLWFCSSVGLSTLLHYNCILLWPFTQTKVGPASSTPGYYIHAESK